MTSFGFSCVLAVAAAGAVLACGAVAAEGGGGTWAAWVDREPPGSGKLIVTGTVETPNPGYKADLVRAGVEKGRLILRIEMRASPGVWTQVIDEKQVRYEEAPYNGGYGAVVIRSETRGDRELPIKTAN